MIIDDPFVRFRWVPPRMSFAQHHFVVICVNETAKLLCLLEEKVCVWLTERKHAARGTFS